MEKGGSTSYKSFPFKHLEEALENQAEHGGRLNKISQYEVIEGYEKETDKCYVLNLKDKAELKNGFRWIKELILQMHNLNMYNYNAYHKLKKNNIQIHSVKTDAFTIDTFNVEKAIEILDFNNDVGRGE